MQPDTTGSRRRTAIPCNGSKTSRKTGQSLPRPLQPAYEHRCGLFGDARQPLYRNPEPESARLAPASTICHFAIADPTIHQFGRHLFVGYRRQCRQSVPLLQPGRDTGRNDRLHFGPGQSLSANFDRLRPGEQTHQPPYTHLQLRRSHRRSGQDAPPLPELRRSLLQPGNAAGSFRQTPEAFEDFREPSN